MMSKRIIYTAADGSLCVVSPAIEDMDQVLRKSVPAGASNMQIVDSESLPADRTFRNAWRAGNGRIDFDMPTCREIQKDRMRAARAPILKALDVEYLRADEAGDSATKARIVSRKQELRDVTKDPRIESASTPEQLKAVWPSCLV